MRAQHDSPTRLTRGLLLAALMLGVLLPTPAQAHALLSSTDPVADQVLETAPDSVTVTFSEPVELAFGALRVHDTDADRVDEGEATHAGGKAEAVTVALQPDLPDGTYTVTYRVISSDSHPIDGAFVFHIGRPGERPEGIGELLLSGDGGSGALEQYLFGVMRWVHFAALFALIGGFFFVWLVWSRSTGGPGSNEVDGEFVSRWRKLMVAAWWGAILATFFGFFLQGASAADVGLVKAFSPGIAGDLLGTRFGMVALLRLATLCVLAGGWVALSRAGSDRGRWPLRHASTVGAFEPPGLFGGLSMPGWVTVAAAILLLVVAGTPGLSGHAGATSPVWLNVPADALHLLAGAIWMGGLVVLIAIGYRAVSSVAAESRVKILGPVVSRFSDVALAAVVVLVITGVYRTWIEVQAWRAFVDAPYGLVLLTKIGVFIPLLVMGAVNNRALKPRIEKAVAAENDGDRPLTTLRKVVRTEVALGAVVIALTALLVNLPPAKTEAGVSGPFIADVAMGTDTLNVIIDPNRVGENIIHLTATTPEGTPVEIKGMKVRFRMPAEDIGPIVATGRKLAPGHFVVQGHQLTIPGDWTLSIEARIDKFTNTTAEVKVTVNG